MTARDLAFGGPRHACGVRLPNKAPRRTDKTAGFNERPFKEFWQENAVIPEERNSHSWI
jgi:hypothetical protein